MLTALRICFEGHARVVKISHIEILEVIKTDFFYPGLIEDNKEHILGRVAEGAASALKGISCF